MLCFKGGYWDTVKPRTGFNPYIKPNHKADISESRLFHKNSKHLTDYNLRAVHESCVLL